MFYFFKLNCKKIFIVLLVALLLFFITQKSLNNGELNVQDGVTFKRSNYE